jgi:hypothetical protein
MQYAQNYGDVKALSMNLMHSNTGITDGIYAVLSDKDTHERISGFGESGGNVRGKEGKQELIAKVRDLLKQLESL